MKIQIHLNGSIKTFYAFQIDVHIFKIVTFYADRKEQEFTISLQPTGNSEILPTYQLFPKGQDIPFDLKNILPRLSKWIKSQE